MAKLVTCLTVLLSFGVGYLRTMTLEDRPDDFGDDLPDDVSLASSPRRAAEEWLNSGGGGGGGGDWEPQVVPVAKRGPGPARFLGEEEEEEEEPEPDRPIAPPIDTDSLLRAAIAIRREKEKEEEEAEAEKEAFREMEEAMRRPRRLDERSHVRDVTPEELQELLGEAPERRKKSAMPHRAKKDSLLHQYLQSALEKKEAAAKKRKRSSPARKKRSEVRKRVVKRGAVAPEERAEAEAGDREAEAATPREALLQDLLVSNALLNAENGYLTDALNAATIAQTKGNDRAILKREMAGIENAEKIEAVMKQLKRDQRRVDEAAANENKVPEAIDETVVVTDNSIANLDACPAVRKLSTGCKSVIEAYKFSMDQDAVDACDAHSVCYGCSSSMQNTRELCDEIFLVQSQNLCSKEPDSERCVSEAGNLLRAMQNVHEIVYQTSSEREKLCRNPCVDAFFSAVYRPRR